MGSVGLAGGNACRTKLIMQSGGFPLGMTVEIC